MRAPSVALAITIASMVSACLPAPSSVETNPAVAAEKSRTDFDSRISANSNRMLEEGREIFRYDSFGSEDFWGGQLRLHEAILGAENGGVGPGLTPKEALRLGLKVDAGRSEEHTSELQSQSNLVCRLLLEKKKLA